MFETNLVNSYFVYNQSILKILQQNKFNISENFNVGLPIDMKSSISKKIVNNYREKYFMLLLIYIVEIGEFQAGQDPVILIKQSLN